MDSYLPATCQYYKMVSLFFWHYCACSTVDSKLKGKVKTEPKVVKESHEKTQKNSSKLTSSPTKPKKGPEPESSSDPESDDDSSMDDSESIEQNESAGSEAENDNSAGSQSEESDDDSDQSDESDAESNQSESEEESGSSDEGDAESEDDSDDDDDDEGFEEDNKSRFAYLHCTVVYGLLFTLCFWILS